MLQDRWKKTTSPLALVVAAIVVLAGCGGGVQAGPAPAPTWSCTPDTSGEPCTPQKAAAQAEEAEAYEEAMHAYREFTKERTRLLSSGGAPTPSPVLQRYGTGRYLEAMQTDIRAAYENGLRITGDVTVSEVQPQTASPSQVSFFACEDASSVRVLDRGGAEVGHGVAGAQLVTATGGAGAWQISDSKLAEDWSCASGN